jgi:hypothetical protein
MTKKRKNSKTSPENIQIKVKQTKSDQTMAQNGANPTYSGHSGQLQLNQMYNQNPGMGSPVYTNNGYFSQMNSGSPVFQQLGSTSAQSHQNSDVFSLILQRLDSMDNKLAQLDSIQSSMKALTVRIDKMDQKINLLESKMKDIENSREFDGGMLDDFSKKQRELSTLMTNINKKEDQQRSVEAELKAEIIELKCRSMRDNLMFYKIKEERDENCEAKVLEFIENELNIENAQTEIKLHRAHRVGAYNSSRIRPIVAKFAFYPDKERVRKSAKNLKGKPYGIAEQFPKEVMETRRKLFPIMKKAREDGKEAYLSVDKLFINKKLYTDTN